MMTAASQKTFDRWAPRLQDSDLDVRLEAVRMLVHVANQTPDLALAALDKLSAYVAERRSDTETEDHEYRMLILGLGELDAHVKDKAQTLYHELATLTPQDGDFTSLLVEFIWYGLEAGRIDPVSPTAQECVRLAGRVLQLKHRAGRSYAMHIADWAEDNDIAA